ncbi:MAG: hypothetical protein RR131_05920 [Anaerovorax sp.]
MQIKKKLTMDDFIEMYHLEKQFYEEDHITPPEETYRWYLCYPNFSTVLEDQGKIIGFLDMFPIKETIFQQIRKGTFNDSNLTAEGIQDIGEMRAGERVNMFLCCVIVDKAYRKTQALQMMIKAQVEYYQQFLDRGIEIESMITDNVTGSGENFSKRMGFKKVTDTLFNSVIYMQKYKDFIKNALGTGENSVLT